MLAAQIAALPFEMLCPHSSICRPVMGRFCFSWGHRQVNLEDFGREGLLQQYYYGRFDTQGLNGGKQAVCFSSCIKKREIMMIIRRNTN